MWSTRLSEYKFSSVRLIILSIFLIFQCFAANVPDYRLAMPAGLILGIAIIAIARMIGDGTNNNMVSSWANLELADLVAGVIISIVALAIVGATPSYISILVGDNAVELANETLNDTITNIATSLNTISKINSRLTAIGGTSFSYGFVVPALGFGKSTYWTPGGGVYALMPPISQAQFSLSTFLFAFIGLKMMLDIILMVVPNVLLPISIFLRFIPFTKKLGSTLIALSLALYIGFPTSLLFVREVNSIIAPKPVLANNLDKLKINLGAGGKLMESICTSNILRGILGINEVGWGLIVCPIICAGTLVAFFACFVVCFWYTIPRIYALVTSTFLNVLSIAISTTINSALENVKPEGLYDTVYAMMIDVHKIGFAAFIDIATIAIILFLTYRAISAAIGGERYLSSMERLL